MIGRYRFHHAKYTIIDDKTVMVGTENPNRSSIPYETKPANGASGNTTSSGGGGNVPIRNIIVFGEDELAGAMAGAAGEKVIVNHVRRNRGGING